MPAITKFSNFNKAILQNLEHALTSHGNISKIDFWIMTTKCK